MKKLVFIGAATMIAFGCGGDDPAVNNGGTNNGGTNNGGTNNGGTNNGGTNNGGTNNGGTNNGGTNNGGTNNGGTNNGGTNNGGTNNGGTNNGTGGLMGDCSFLEVDQDGDGTYEAAQLVQLTGDLQTLFVTDLDRDGNPEWTQARSYDAEGRITEQWQDGDGDGTYEWVARWTYDANGNVTSILLDEGDDGTIEFEIIVTWDGDNMLTWVRDGSFAMDGSIVPKDGTPDYTDTRTWAGPGLIATVRLDADGDGDNEMTVDITYDAGDRVTRFERDGLFDFENNQLIVDADGTADVVETHTYDANGLRTGSEFDGWVNNGVAEQADGTPDLIERNITYDNGTEPTALEISGRRDLFGTITTQADGTFARLEVTNTPPTRTITVDEASDASIDLTVVFTSDANGDIVGESRDGVIDNNQTLLEAMDGTPDWLVTRTFHKAALMASENVDAGGDGIDDQILTITYDANDMILSVTRDGLVNGVEIIDVADGTLDQEEYLTYDAQARQTSYERLVNGTREVASQTAFGMCADLETMF